MSALRKLFDYDCADPSALFHDGHIYLYGSRAWDEPQKNIQVWRSTSFTGKWENVGCALTSKPSWGKKSVEFWAPDVPRIIGSQFRLYYATNPDSTDGMAIAMAESKVPYNFKPAAEFIVSGHGYSAVDPFVLTYRGGHWLFWGSQHEPIRCRRLDPSGTAFAKYSREKTLLFPSKRKYEQLLEGFFLHYVPQIKSWVAYVSGSDTWNRDNYGVTVFTSPTPFGPFTRARVLIKPTAEWWAPGQNCVVTIGDKYYFVCHAVDAKDPYLPGTEKLKRVPCVSEIKFTSSSIVLSEVA